MTTFQPKQEYVIIHGNLDKSKTYKYMYLHRSLYKSSEFVLDNSPLALPRHHQQTSLFMKGLNCNKT